MGRWGLLIGIALVLGSAFGFIQWMKGVEVEATTAPVLMAKRYIPAHTIITEEMIEMRIIDENLKNAEALQSVDSVVGKETAVPLGTGEQFIDWKLDTRSLIPNPGENLFTFPTDAIASVDNMVRRGDIVSIWVEVEPSVLDQLQKTAAIGEIVPASMVVLPNARVAYVKNAQGGEVVDQPADIRVKQIITGSPIQRDAQEHDQFRMNPTSTAATVTYILTDAQYQLLVGAQRLGKLKMGLFWPFQTKNDSSLVKSVDDKSNDDYALNWLNRLQQRKMTEATSSSR